jgi:hypothetical protein
MKLEYGYGAGVPDDVEIAWGARLIFPDDLVVNRQGFLGRDLPGADDLVSWLNGEGCGLTGRGNGAIKQALNRARELAASGELRQDEARQIVLYEDGRGVIRGNPNGSFGYLYICGYLKS